MRITAGTVVGLLATGHSIEVVLALYPYLEREDVLAALSYAAWRAEEVELPLRASYGKSVSRQPFVALKPEPPAPSASR